MGKYSYRDEKGYLRYNSNDKLVHRNRAYKEIYQKGNYNLKFSDYQVHHIDGNKINNDIDNLQIVTREEHEAIHGISATRKHVKS